MLEKFYSKIYEKKMVSLKKIWFFFKVCFFIKYFGIWYINKKDV